MDLPLLRVEGPPDAYAEFCANQPDACNLAGAAVIDATDTAQAELERINAEANRQIARISDWEFNGLQDVWSFPFNCQGDCEDLALEKRRRLVAAGFPGASLTIATAMHRTEQFPHAVLLAETSSGTWVLDDLSDDVLCWDRVPYDFVRRETPDGVWSRFAPPE